MITLEHVGKIYRADEGEVRALDDVSLSVNEGEFVVLRGPSGSGKSTLLLTIAGLVTPTQGNVIVRGKNLYALTGRERARFRSETMGFVFQMFHLLPYLDAIENVLVPTMLREDRANRSESRAVMERLQLSNRLRHRPSELSTGERQRVAIARALLNRPRLILADEPTGNLDPENAAEVLHYLTEFHEGGGTVLLVTHDQSAADTAGRIIQLREGRVIAGNENR
jgi:ABC-type lipoprotein export system ATPase subunit